MKATLRYLLMVVAMVSVLGVYAQSLAKQPETKMHSTSTMVGTGTTLPQAAATGVYVTGSTPASYSPAGRPGHIRKAGEDEEFEDEGEEPSSGNPGEPDPIGDGLWVLLAIAAAYALLRVYRRERRV